MQILSKCSATVHENTMKMFPVLSYQHFLIRQPTELTCTYHHQHCLIEQQYCQYLQNNINYNLMNKQINNNVKNNTYCKPRIICMQLNS